MFKEYVFIGRVINIEDVFEGLTLNVRSAVMIEESFE